MNNSLNYIIIASNHKMVIAPQHLQLHKYINKIYAIALRIHYNIVILISTIIQTIEM